MGMVLEGVKVLDMSQLYAGPATSMYLADQGADVLKVEMPGLGDNSRHQNTAPYLGDLSRPFLALNRNKRSIAVDTRKPEGLEVVRRLVRQADVMLVNFRQSSAQHLMLTYEDVLPLNRRLVYASISAFGPQGPDSNLPGYDLVIQARSGILGARRMPDGTPVTFPILAADMATPMILAYGIVLALLERERSGQGQKVEAALLAAAIAMQGPYLAHSERDKPSETVQPRGSAVATPYRCSDDQWLEIVIMTLDQWKRFCHALELPHLADDPDYDTYSKREANSHQIYPIFEGVFATRPRDEWLKALEEAQIPCAAIGGREMVFNDPQVKANQILVEQEHPLVGKFTSVGIPFSMSRTPGAIMSPAPALGQHTREVLLEYGFNSEEVQHLQEAMVVHQWDGNVHYRQV